jgi:hypothetical protein
LAVFAMSMDHQDMFDMLVIIQHMVGEQELMRISAATFYLALLAFSHLYNNPCIRKPLFKGL